MNFMETAAKRWIMLLVLTGLLGPVVVPVSQAQEAVGEARQLRERLNKIFYWHLADELELTPQQEKALMNVLEEVQAKRERLLTERDLSLSSLRGLGKKATQAAAEPHLLKFRSVLESLTALEGEEYDRIKAILGVELLGRFYIIRDDVTSRIRDALRGTASAKAGKR
jgi:hypothetical protein